MFLFLTFDWFWICFVAFVLLMVAAAYDAFIVSVFVTIAALVTLHFFTSVDVIEFCVLHKTFFILFSVLYFPLGAAWATFKWWLKLSDSKTKLSEKKADWYKSTKHLHIKPDDDGLIKYNNSAHDDDWIKYRNNYRPIVKDYKIAIVNWIAYWPVSVVWFILGDFVTRIAKAIYNTISDMFNKMSEKMFKEV